MMVDILWVPMGLFAALMTSCMLLVTEHFKLPAAQFLMGLRFFSLLLLTPLILIFPWPQDPVFYIATITAILIICGMDILMISSAVKHGAGVTSRILPLSAFATFFFWTIYSSATFHSYLETPLRSAGILLAIGAAAFFSIRLRQCEISRAAMKILLPVVVMASVVTVCGKVAIDAAPQTGPLMWNFMQALILTPVYAVMVYGTKGRFERAPLNKTFAIAGILAALCSVGHIIVKSKAFHLVENPAYVMILLLTSPLWILLYYKIKKHEEKADIWSGIGIVFSALALIALTQIK